MTHVDHLPGPNSDLWDWQIRGACRGAESSVFFHPEGERGRARAMREARAKAICNRCPVLDDCRAHALKIAEPYGIWGGMSESERNDILRSRPRRSTVAASAKPAGGKTPTRTPRKSSPTSAPTRGTGAETPTAKGAASTSPTGATSLTGTARTPRKDARKNAGKNTPSSVTA